MFFVSLQKVNNPSQEILKIVIKEDLIFYFEPFGQIAQRWATKHECFLKAFKCKFSYQSNPLRLCLVCEKVPRVEKKC